MSDPSATTWQPIDSAPPDSEILVYTAHWGPIIALYSSEFDQWLSRMQVPVSMNQADEAPTHWQALPPAPNGQGA